MLNATWRCLGSPFWLAIGLMMLVPALAEAQLFPDRTIRRERPPCAMENPYYKQVRAEYFGYYPTCWRRFPEGWACPCPNSELPDMLEKFRREPLDPKRKPVGDDPASADDLAGPMDGEDPDKPKTNIPAVPLPDNKRSPFELEEKGNAAPGPGPGGAQPPATDPLDPTAPGSTRPIPGSGRPGAGNRPGGTSALMDMPSLPDTAPTTGFEPTRRPGSMATVPDAMLTSNDDPATRADLGPLPSAPVPSANAPVGGRAASEIMPTLGVPSPVGAPAQAPRRKSLLGNLFNRGNTRTR